MAGETARPLRHQGAVSFTVQWPTVDEKHVRPVTHLSVEHRPCGNGHLLSLVECHVAHLQVHAFARNYLPR